MDTRVPKPKISTSLAEGLEDSFDEEQLSTLNHALDKTDFTKIYQKIGLITNLVGEDGFTKIPSFKNADFYKVEMDLSEYFPLWEKLDINKKHQIVKVLNDESLITYAIRAIPDNKNNFILDINPFIREKENKLKNTGNIFSGGIAKAVSISILIPHKTPQSDWEISNAVMQKKNDIYRKDMQKNEAKALKNTGNLLFSINKNESLHVFKLMTYGVRLNDSKSLEKIALSLKSEQNKLSFLTKFILSFINENKFLLDKKTFPDDFEPKNILVRKSGLVNFIDYAGVNLKRKLPDINILWKMNDMVALLSLVMKQNNDPTWKTFTQILKKELENDDNTLDNAKISIIKEIQKAFPTRLDEIQKSISSTEAAIQEKYNLHSSDTPTQTRDNSPKPR
jgi:hypothetical protein